MGFDSIVYLTDPYGSILYKISFKIALVLAVLVVAVLVLIVLYVHEKVSKNHEKARFDKELEYNKKENENRWKKHGKIRDKLICKDGKKTNNIRILKDQNRRLEMQIKISEKDRDDAIFASKRRAKKIKKMEMVFQLKIEGSEAYLSKQLENPNRSMSSIIKSYDWSKVDL